MQINKRLHLSSSLIKWLHLSSLWLVQKNNRPKQVPFIAASNWTVSTVQCSVKYFLSRILGYSGKSWRRRCKKNSKCKAINEKISKLGKISIMWKCQNSQVTKSS